MSIAEIERFVGDLKAVEALRTAAEKQASESQAAALQDFIAFASSKGYAFTGDEMMEFAKSTHDARKRLTDVELDGVSGGNLSNVPPGNLLFAASLFFSIITEGLNKGEQRRAERSA